MEKEQSSPTRRSTHIKDLSEHRARGGTTHGVVEDYRMDGRFYKRVGERTTLSNLQNATLEKLGNYRLVCLLSHIRTALDTAVLAAVK